MTVGAGRRGAAGQRFAALCKHAQTLTRVIARPRRSVAHPVVEATADDLTGIAGVSLWGELLDRLGLVAEADRRVLRPGGPGGYTGGECYRALVETMLAGGDFISDRSLLDGEATRALRGQHALASVTTLWRFLAGADLGRVKKAGTELASR